MSKKNNLSEITSLMNLYGVSIEDIQLHQKTASPQKKEMPRFVLILAYLGGLLMLGGLCVFVSQYWESFGSAERIIITYGTGVSLYICALALPYKKTSSLVLSNLFVIAFLFQYGGLGVALMELFPGGSNLPLFVLSITAVMLLQSSITFLMVRLTAVLFMLLLFLLVFYGALYSYVVAEQIVPLGLFEDMPTSSIFYFVVSLSFLVMMRHIHKTPYKAISGVGFFFSMALYYFSSYFFLDESKLTDAFGVFVVAGLILSQVFRSKAMLALTALAFLGHLGEITAKYFLDTAWWPLAVVGFGLVIVLVSIVLPKMSRTSLFAPKL